MLDHRRTPIRVVDVIEETGTWVMELLKFEDVGKTWEYPFEMLLKRFQMERNSKEAAEAQVVRYGAIMERLSQPLHIPALPSARVETMAQVAMLQVDVANWMDQHARFPPSELTLKQETGDERVYADLQAWMAHRGLAEVERDFAERYVSNPWSGELVKGHRIVIAEMGLSPYQGTVVRDDTLFERLGRGQRADHVRSRMAFIHELFHRAGLVELPLFRGIATDHRIEPNRNQTFVSCTPSRRIAEAFSSYGRVGALFNQMVPVDRVFMTYLETEAMNRQFKEVEVILFFEEGNLAF